MANEEQQIPENEPEGVSRLTNLVEALSDQKLDEIGSELLRQVNIDITSRSEWLDKLENWIALATQISESKSFPWPGASNIKFPLLQTAAVQFHSRAFPALLGNTTPVRGKVIGKDKDGTKANRANRIGTYMSNQVLYDMEDWVDDMDRALLILPIIGCVYKKTFFNPRTGMPQSEVIHPRDFIINYDARIFEHARKTHRLWKSPNEIKELQNRKIYREFEGDDFFQPPKTASESRDKTQGLSNSGVADPYALQEMYEVHCILDLDEDGYSEPYIVTIRETDGKVYRIVEGFSEGDVLEDERGVVAIRPVKYFTPYFFMPDPESKTHGLGFGTMVGPINDSVNTIINQLTDAGTLSVTNGGFLGRGIRIKGGDLKFKPNEWKPVNNTGDDLKKGIFPMPVREPSNVLFQLLGMLVDSGKDLTSVQDLMVGRNPGQNQPFSTSQMVMEQGLKVFNGIYKRLYRAMSAEFRLLFKVNDQHLDLKRYMEVLDDQGMEVQEAMSEAGPEAVLQFLSGDFKSEDMDVLPTAEPDMVAEVQRAMKAEALMAKVEMGLPLNPQAVLKRMLEAEQHEDIGELMDVPDPAPDPELAFREEELKQSGIKLQIDAHVAESEINLNDVKGEVALMEAEGVGIERMHARFIAEKKARTEEFDSLTKRVKEANNASKDRKSGESTSGDKK